MFSHHLFLDRPVVSSSGAKRAHLRVRRRRRKEGEEEDEEEDEEEEEEEEDKSILERRTCVYR